MSCEILEFIEVFLRVKYCLDMSCEILDSTHLGSIKKFSKFLFYKYSLS
jgi:hypothetical protein